MYLIVLCEVVPRGRQGTAIASTWLRSKEVFNETHNRNEDFNQILLNMFSRQ